MVGEKLTVELGSGEFLVAFGGFVLACNELLFERFDVTLKLVYE